MDNDDNNNFNNNINGNKNNTTLLQQLLNRLRQAHDSIDLDPVQGQFLLDASGGDLDLAVGLYWEDSVAHHAVSHHHHHHNSNNDNDCGSNSSSSKDKFLKVKKEENDKDIFIDTSTTRNNGNNNNRAIAAAANSNTSKIKRHNKSDIKKEKRIKQEEVEDNEEQKEDDDEEEQRYNSLAMAMGFNRHPNQQQPPIPPPRIAAAADAAFVAALQNQLQLPSQGQQPQQQRQIPNNHAIVAAAAASSLVASHISDDEAAAIAERIWKQIKPNNNFKHHQSYKNALQKQIKKMTRRRRKKQHHQQQMNNNNMMMMKNDDSQSDDDHHHHNKGNYERLKNDYEIGQEDDNDVGGKKKRRKMKSTIDSDNIHYKLNHLPSKHMKSSRRSLKNIKGHSYHKMDGNEYEYSSSDENYAHHEDVVADTANADADAGESTIIARNKKNEINSLKKILNFSCNEGHKEENNSELKSYVGGRSNNDNLKRKRKNDHDYNYCKEDENACMMSDGHDDSSDSEKVNIDDLKDAFNLSKKDVVKPSLILWGRIKYSDESDDDDNNNGNESNDDENNNNINIEQQPPQLEPNNNENGNNDSNNAKIENDSGEVIVKKEEKDDQDGLDVVSNGDANDDDNEDDDDDEEEEEEMDEDATIPRTWLSAGFELSPCGTGLVLPRPVSTELARLRRIQSAKFTRTTSSIQPPLPPYHCGGMTALLSIVTALLYTGATIQGNEVNCNSSRRKPFADLSLDERKEQFPERLTDVLAALLFIVAKESVKHRSDTLEDIEERFNKKRKLAKYYKMTSSVGYDSDDDCESNMHGKELPDEDSELMMKQLMQHRVQLCQVCHWEEDKASGDLKVPLDNLISNNMNLSFEVTMTNSKDLRSFVLANLRSFMSPGGCALFLETIVHIYGIPRLTRILQKSNPTKFTTNRSLIRCNCEDKVLSQWEETLRKYKKEAMSSTTITQPVVKKAPPGHDCISNELINLLISGQPHKVMNRNNLNTTASKLGFGFLSIDNDNDDDSKSNIRQETLNIPSQSSMPIWIVRGSSSYSVLWNNDKMMMAYNNHDKVNDIIKKDRQLHPFHLSFWNSWYDPSAKKFDGKVIPNNKILSDNPNNGNIPFLNQKEGVDDDYDGNNDNNIEIVAHPEDERLFKDYRRWRFSISDERTKDSSSCNIENWISYFRLGKKEKKLVEKKMSPQVNQAIWSLWPDSEISWTPSSKLIV